MLTPKRRAKIKHVVANRQSGIIVVLEDLHDPHNAAAILRTCDAFGIQAVHFIFEKEKKYNPHRVGRVSSSSANKWLDYTVWTSTRDCMAKLKKQNFFFIGTALANNAKNILSARLTHKKIALVLGNENRGLSEDAQKLCDEILMIPMQGMVQSLNVSVTASICLFEITRQRNKKIKQFLLSPQDRKILMSNFLERAL